MDDGAAAAEPMAVDEDTPALHLPDAALRLVLEMGRTLNCDNKSRASILFELLAERFCRGEVMELIGNNGDVIGLVVICRGLGIAAAEAVTLGNYPLSDHGMVAFVPCAVFVAGIPHYVFKVGPLGVGYYRDSFRWTHDVEVFVKAKEFYPAEGPQAGAQVQVDGRIGTVVSVLDCGRQIKVSWDDGPADKPPSLHRWSPDLAVPGTTVLDDQTNPDSVARFTRSQSLRFGDATRNEGGTWRPKASFAQKFRRKFVPGRVCLAPIFDSVDQVFRYRLVTVGRVSTDREMADVHVIESWVSDDERAETHVVHTALLRPLLNVEAAPAKYVVSWVHRDRHIGDGNPSPAKTSVDGGTAESADVPDTTGTAVGAHGRAFTVPADRLRRLDEAAVSAVTVEACVQRHLIKGPSTPGALASRSATVLRDPFATKHFSLHHKVGTRELRADDTGLSGLRPFRQLLPLLATLRKSYAPDSFYGSLFALCNHVARFTLAYRVIDALAAEGHRLRQATPQLAKAEAAARKLALSGYTTLWEAKRREVVDSFVGQLGVFHQTLNAFWRRAVKATAVQWSRLIDKWQDHQIEVQTSAVVPRLSVKELQKWQFEVTNEINPKVVEVLVARRMIPSGEWLTQVRDLSIRGTFEMSAVYAAGKVVDAYRAFRSNAREQLAQASLSPDGARSKTPDDAAPRGEAPKAPNPAAAAAAAAAVLRSAQLQAETTRRRRTSSEAEELARRRAMEEAERARPKLDLVYRDPPPLPAPAPVLTTLADGEMHDVMALSEFLATFNVPLGLELRPVDYSWETLEAALAECHPAGDLGNLLTSLVWQLMGSEVCASANLRVLGLTANYWDVRASYASELLRRMILALDGSALDPEYAVKGGPTQVEHLVFRLGEKMLFSDEELQLAEDLAHTDFLDLPVGKKLLALNLLTALCLGTRACRDHIAAVNDRDSHLAVQWHHFTAAQAEPKGQIQKARKLIEAITKERDQLKEALAATPSTPTSPPPTSPDGVSAPDALRQLEARIRDLTTKTKEMQAAVETDHARFLAQYVTESVANGRRLRPCLIGRDRHYRSLILLQNIPGVLVHCPPVDEFMCTWLRGRPGLPPADFSGREFQGYPSLPENADALVTEAVQGELEAEWPGMGRSPVERPSVYRRNRQSARHPRTASQHEKEPEVIEILDDEDEKPVQPTLPTQSVGAAPPDPSAAVINGAGSADVSAAMEVDPTPEVVVDGSGASAAPSASHSDGPAPDTATRAPTLTAVAVAPTKDDETGGAGEAAAAVAESAIAVPAVAAPDRVDNDAMETEALPPSEPSSTDPPTAAATAGPPTASALMDTDPTPSVDPTPTDDTAGAAAEAVSSGPAAAADEPKIGYRIRVLWDGVWTVGVIQDVTRKESGGYQLKIRYADGDVGDADYPEEGIEILRPSLLEKRWYRIDTREELDKFKAGLMGEEGIREKPLKANIEYYEPAIRAALERAHPTPVLRPASSDIASTVIRENICAQLHIIESALPPARSGPKAAERIGLFWRMHDLPDPPSFGQAMLAWSDCFEADVWRTNAKWTTTKQFDATLLDVPKNSAKSWRVNKPAEKLRISELKIGHRCGVLDPSYATRRDGTILQVLHKQKAKNSGFVHKLTVGEMPMREGQVLIRALLDDGHCVWVLHPHPHFVVYGRVNKAILETGDKAERIRVFWAWQLLAATNWAQIALCATVLERSLSVKKKAAAALRRREYQYLQVRPRVHMIVHCLIPETGWQYAKIEEIDEAKGRVRVSPTKSGVNLGWRDYPSTTTFLMVRSTSDDAQSITLRPKMFVNTKHGREWRYYEIRRIEDDPHGPGKTLHLKDRENNSTIVRRCPDPDLVIVPDPVRATDPLKKAGSKSDKAPRKRTSVDGRPARPSSQSQPASRPTSATSTGSDAGGGGAASMDTDAAAPDAQRASPKESLVVSLRVKRERTESESSESGAKRPRSAVPAESPNESADGRSAPAMPAPTLNSSGAAAAVSPTSDRAESEETSEQGRRNLTARHGSMDDESEDDAVIIVEDSSDDDV